jgi:uncharacterized membrane protein
MSTHLIAATYEREEIADRALGALTDLADQGKLALKDAVVVVKAANGKVELRQTQEPSAGDGIVGGGTIGLLLGLALGIPVAGSLVGMVGGGGATAIDRGVSDERMRRYGAELEAGQAALFALVADADWPLLRERLTPYGGEIAASEVDDEVAAALGPNSTGP